MAEYLTLFSFFTIGPALVLLWLAAVALYRMTLHPLAGIPGPKLAAISGLHEAWWSAVKRGRYLLKYDQMHEDYGRASTGTKRPVVRINPNEVHIRDPDYYEVLFSHNMKIDKDPFIYTPAHLPHRIPPRVGSATRRTLGPEAGGTAPGSSPQRARMERCFVPFSKQGRALLHRPRAGQAMALRPLRQPVPPPAQPRAVRHDAPRRGTGI
ncbi:hypothetical protein JOL62DRAFT_558745 [Phyllosticta paracitricarpa]|uniref:Cytochrome P450 n=1 Tax=Phyllosticta paracitricarpa TaxID=2016321 RepID=A0ABR1MZF0_9PEZI